MVSEIEYSARRFEDLSIRLPIPCLRQQICAHHITSISYIAHAHVGAMNIGTIDEPCTLTEPEEMKFRPFRKSAVDCKGRYSNLRENGCPN